MKKYFSYAILASFALLSACSNDFDLIADADNTPVTFGFLDRQDSIHYIRVEKTFIDENINALELAKDPNQLYYDNISVQLDRVDETNTVTQSLSLEEVNGTDLGLGREDGVFATNPNKLYRFILPNDDEFEGGEKVRLTVNTGEEKAPVTAETTIVGDVEFIDGQPATQIVWKYDRETNFGWRTSKGSALFDLVLYINIDEIDPNDNTNITTRTLEWVIQRNIRRDGETPRMNVDIEGVRFFQFIQSQLQDAPRVRRFFRSIDVVISAGGQELLDFLDITQANTGITSSQEIPSFTNFDNGGLGLFTSRSTAVTTVNSLERETRDSLLNGIYTKDLNFQ